MEDIQEEIQSHLFRYWTHQNKFFNEHVSEHTLIHIFSGEMILRKGVRRIILHEGETALLRRNHLVSSVMQPAGDVPFSGLAMHFDIGFLLKNLAKFKLPQADGEAEPTKKLYVPVANNADLAAFFESLSPYFTPGSQPTKRQVEARMKEAVALLLQACPEAAPVLFDCVEPWKVDISSFMERHFADPFTLEDYAHYTARTLEDFKRDFAAIYGEAPSRWLMHRRLEEAHRRLETHEVLPAAIYQDLGFKNFSHFSAAFKRQFGYPPSQT